MKNYISLNKRVYDAIATQFQSKKPIRNENTVRVVDSFLKIIPENFKKPLSILELGPGSGYAAKLLSGKSHNVFAIELSKPMAQLAQKTAPKAEVIVGEFLSHDFKKRKFDCILGLAFVHLFPQSDAKLVTRKVFDLLNENGIAMISTTKHKEDNEGYYIKSNFKDSGRRFRHNYTKESFIELLTSCGLKTVSYSEEVDDEVLDKVWMKCVVQKT